MLAIASITFDCADATELAAFWSAALDRPIDPGANAYFATIGSAETGPTLMFLKVDEEKRDEPRTDLASGAHPARTILAPRGRP